MHHSLQRKVCLDVFFGLAFPSLDGVVKIVLSLKP